MMRNAPHLRPLPVVALALLGALQCACSRPGSNLALDLGRAPPLNAEVAMGEEIGRLLSPEEGASRRAERRLLALTGAERDRLVAYRERIPHERDPRWLNVLDEHHALPLLAPVEHLDFLLWKAARPERFYGMKARSRLLELGRRHPQALLDRLSDGGPGWDVVAVALAVDDRLEAVPPLLERYRHSRTTRDRQIAAETLATLVGEERRPRVAGRPDEIARDAAAIEAWYADLREGLVDGSAGEPAAPVPDALEEPR